MVVLPKITLVKGIMHTVKRKIIILADKDKLFCERLVELLKDALDIRVACWCTTRLGTLKSAEEHQPDVILIGTELHDCSGIEVMQLISESLPKTNIIMLTNSSKLSADDFISAVEVGAIAHVSKFTSAESLIKVIELISRGEANICTSMAVKLLQKFNLPKEHSHAAELGNGVHLSKQEDTILSLIAKEGLTNKEIANTLFISEYTVKVHLRNTMRKLHAHTRQHAVALARSGWDPAYSRA